MHEIRCPSCELRLWLHQGMSRDVPLPHECPSCRASRPIDRRDVAAARLAARIDHDHHAERPRDGDTLWRSVVGAGASR